MKFILSTCAALLMLTISAKAQIGVYPRTGNLITNGSTVVIAAAGQSNLVSTVHDATDVFRGRGMALLPTLYSTNASTSQVGISFVVSGDGSTYSTDKIWLITTLNGTTPVTVYTNYTPTILDNVRKIKILQITNGHDASLFVSNVTWSAAP